MLVKLYATFRLIAGVRSIEIELRQRTTARQAVDQILDQLPVLRPHWLNETGDLHAHVHGFLNGQEIPTLQMGWETVLQPTDTLDFIPPVAGG